MRSKDQTSIVKNRRVSPRCKLWRYQKESKYDDLNMQYVYFGALDDGRCLPKSKKSKKISLETKQILLKSYIISVFLCGNKCWQIFSQIKILEQQSCGSTDYC